jgi:hypothetical protein
MIMGKKGIPQNVSNDDLGKCRCGYYADVTTDPNSGRKIKKGKEGGENICMKCYKLMKEEDYHYKRHIKATCGG